MSVLPEHTITFDEFGNNIQSKINDDVYRPNIHEVYEFIRNNMNMIKVTHKNNIITVYSNISKTFYDCNLCPNYGFDLYCKIKENVLNPVII